MTSSEEQAQHFALALVSSADRVAQAWDRRQQQLTDEQEEVPLLHQGHKGNGIPFAAVVSPTATMTTPVFSTILCKEGSDVSGDSQGRQGASGDDETGCIPHGALLAYAHEPAGTEPTTNVPSENGSEDQTGAATVTEYLEGDHGVESDGRGDKRVTVREGRTVEGQVGTAGAFSVELSESFSDHFPSENNRESLHDKGKRRRREADEVGSSLDRESNSLDACSGDAHREKAVIVPWIINHMGFVEKVGMRLGFRRVDATTQANANLVITMRF